MMILTAVILLAAFLAISAMVARVGDIAGETARDREDPFGTEFSAVERGLLRSSADLASDPSVFFYDQTRFLQAVNATIDSMVRVEAQRGYWLVATVGYPCPGELVFTVELRSTDAYARKVLLSGVPCVF